jgi:small GTP-binding protein
MNNLCTLKIIFIGEKCTGKTSLLYNFQNKSNINEHITTVGIDYGMAQIPIQVNEDNYYVKLNIYDTGGEERFFEIAKNYFNNSFICFIMYDITKFSTYESIESHITKFINVNKKCKYFFIIGIKTDYPLEQQLITIPKVNDLIIKLNTKYGFQNFRHFRISITEKQGISNIHDSIREIILETYKSIMMNTLYTYPDGITFYENKILSVINERNEENVIITKMKKKTNYLKKICCCFY